jgi:flagellar biosynthetic protein FlhB
MAEGAEDDAERSEEPTQKRLADAHKRGDVVKSQEVNNWFLLAGAAGALAMFGANSAEALAGTLADMLGHLDRFAVDGTDLRVLMLRLGAGVAAAFGLPLLFIGVAAAFGHVVQHGLLWTTEPLVPKLSKISPGAGLKRLFSKQTIGTLVKGLAKLAIVGAAVAAAVWPERDRLGLLPALEVGALAGYLDHLALKLLGTAVAVLAVVAIADWVYQRQSWLAKHRMSLREIKDEHKQMEGDPHIKGKLRQLRLQKSKKRMMARVPEATVVIANPTHFAVALKYEAGMSAPLCLAKGADLIALRIRTLAEENRVPVVENPPLARALYATAEIDREIPSEHYRAVAEVIGYVMKLKRRALR